MSRQSFITRCWPVVEQAEVFSPPPAISSGPVARSHSTAWQLVARVVDETAGAPIVGLPYMLIGPAGTRVGMGLTGSRGEIDVGVLAKGHYEIRLADVKVRRDKAGKVHGEITPYIPAQRTPITDEDLAAAMQIAWPSVFGQPASLEALHLLLAHRDTETSVGGANCYCYNIGNTKVPSDWSGAITYYQCGEITSDGKELMMDFSPRFLMGGAYQNRWCAFPDLASGVMAYLSKIKNRALAAEILLSSPNNLQSYVERAKTWLAEWDAVLDARNDTIIAWNNTHPDQPKKILNVKAPISGWSRARLFAFALWKQKYYNASPVGYANTLDASARRKSKVQLTTDPAPPSLPFLEIAGCDPLQSVSPFPEGLRPTPPGPTPEGAPPLGTHGHCGLKVNCGMVFAKHMRTSVTQPDGRVETRLWTDGDPVAPPITRGGALRSVTVLAVPTADPATPVEIRLPKPPPSTITLTLQTNDGRPVPDQEIVLRSEDGDELVMRTDSQGRLTREVERGFFSLQLEPQASPTPPAAGARLPFSNDEVGQSPASRRRRESVDQLVGELLGYQHGLPAPRRRGE